MAARFLYILPVLIAAPLLVHGGPWCFKCDGNAHPAVCQAVVVCGDHENCYADKHLNNNGVLQYTSGCKPMADCVTTVRKRSVPATQCSECCTGTACNAKVCGAQDVSVSGARLWCVHCDNQQQPSDCDQVKLCSQDEVCSVSKNNVFGLVTYSMGCEKKTVCQGKTLATDNFQCCSDNLCNTNTALVSPDQYTPPPPTTTTPPPSAASAKLNETSVDFVSQHLSNETIELFCELTGFPYPNVTWSFIPDANVTSGNATSGSGNATTASVSATTTTTPSTPVCTCPTVASNGTLAGTTPSAGVTTTPTPGANSTTTAANSTGPAGTPITTGVTTTSNLSTLVITSPSASTAGTYVCSADNGNGPQESTAHVSYSAAPKIAGAANETTQGNARDDVFLECDVDGSPAPKIDWEFPPNAGGVEKLANGSLLIHNAHGDNSGEYKCLANNTAGTAEKDFTVTITDNSATTCPTAATTTVATTVPPTTATPATCPPPVTCPVATCPTCPPPATCPVVTCPTTLASLITSAALCPTTPTTAATTTTPTTTTTTPTTTTTTTTTTPTTPVVTTAHVPYGITTQGTLWHNVMGGPHLLHCDPPQGSHDPVIWSRLEQNYDHVNHNVFSENFHGQLTITKSSAATSVLDLTGVYECSLVTQPSVTARYVLFSEIPGPIDCRQDFTSLTSPVVPGSVLRTTCGPCQQPATTTANFIWRDFVCSSAAARGLIQPQTGGTVTWLIQNNNQVSLLKEENGHVVLVP